MKKFRNPLLALTGLALLVVAALAVTPAAADGGAAHRVRNLNFGVSGGNVKDISRQFCCSGTLGALIQDNNGVKYILSNNHVLGLAGRATVGDDVSQPGRIDANCQITTVVANFTVAPSLGNNVDAAIAQLRDNQMDETGEIEDIGLVGSPTNAAVGMAVQKSGRTTGHTTGSVSSISTTVSVRYPKSCGSGGGTLHRFTNQVVINSSTFSAGGDSGSLIVTNNSSKQPVALLFAGSSSSTIGNPIIEVMTKVGTALGGGRTVSFVGSGGAASPSLGFSITEDGTFMQELPDVAANAAARVLANHEADLMSRPGVIGVGVGQGSQDKSEAVIVLYINKAERTDAKGLPKVIDGVRVRRVFTDEFVAR